MPAMRKMRARLGALVVGLAATAAGCALFAAGTLSRLDDAGLDFHFRHFSSIQADPRIVLIDIDDSSLEAIGEWPWPRRRHADIIRTLHEAGAKEIVYDIVFAEPTLPRLARTQGEGSLATEPGPEAHATLDSAVTNNGGPAAEIINDDHELAEAIAAAGNVYLATFGRPEPRTLPATKPESRRSVSEKLREVPELTLPQLELSLGTDEFHQTPERSALAAAFHWAKSVSVIKSELPAAPDESEASLAPAFDLTPPILPLAQAAHAFGLVNFERRSAGGMIREVALLANYEGSLLPQLGFAAAMGELGIDWSSVSVENGSLRIRVDDNTMHVPRDRSGLTLINWHTPAPLQWEHSFQHIPASRVLEVQELRRGIQANANYFSQRTTDLVRERHADTPAEYTVYMSLLERGIALREAHRRGEAAEVAKLTVELQEIDEKLRAIEQEALPWVEHAWREWKDPQPQDEEERAHRDMIQDLHKQFILGELQRDLAQKNERLQSRIAALLGELDSKVRDRICFVGYTASTVADFVASPVYPNMPGVMAHANVANMLLQGKFVQRAETGLRLGLIALAGIMVTFLACGGGWRLGVLGLVAAVACLGVLGWWQFEHAGIYLSTPVAAMVAAFAWAGTTALRQGTEERSRRHLQRALRQYTSPAIAARIAEQVGAEGLTPQAANVTCFFADLRNFTALSERLGPERTRDVLNPYLQSVSDALVAQGAMVNKFTGDGVFAFFNSPLLPSAEHARFACEAALETIRAVDALGARSHNAGARIPSRTSAGPNQTKPVEPQPRQPNASPSTEGTNPLIVRIGLASGEAFVGDYGSRTKLDYTCIGDTVNVASRLEDANKFFGTRVLVNQATRNGAGPEFVFRYLGRVLLMGKEQAVETYELLGRAAELDGSAAEFVGAFEQAVRSFQSRSWQDCAAALERCRLVRPQDEAVGIYEGAVRLARNSSVRELGSGAIRAF